MAPKGPRSSESDKTKDVQETEDPLQAIVSLDKPHIVEQDNHIEICIARCLRIRSRQDSIPSQLKSPVYFQCLEPWGLTLFTNGNQCLLPLANVPLIEYTLEFLASNGLDEVYVYCGSHTDQFEDYLV